MIKGKLNLRALDSHVMKLKGQSGQVECLVIPIEKNNLFKSEKGNVYLDFVAFDTDPDKRKDPDNTHMVVLSLPKEKRDAGERGPILGNLQDGSGGGQSADAPAQPSEALATDDGEADLPF